MIDTVPRASSRKPLPVRGLLAALLSLAACASGADLDWIDSRRHPDFPEQAYLVGVGTAQSGDRDLALRQARDRAVADISGQLETRIRSEVTTLVRESLRVVGGQTHAESVGDMSTEVRGLTEATLPAIQPVAQHYDAERRAGAVMVVIKRSDFAVRARDEIEALDARIGALASEADRLAAEGRLFQATRRYNDVERLALDRVMAAARANFVQPGTAGPAPVSFGRLLERQQAASAQVQMVFACRHLLLGRPGPSPLIEQAFVRAFARLGVAVRPAGVDAAEIAARWQDSRFLRQVVGDGAGQALLLFVDAVTDEQATGEGDLISVRSSGNARLIDGATGELLVSAVHSPDAARKSPQIGRAAQRTRLVDAALAQLAEHLFAGVLEQF